MVVVVASHWRESGSEKRKDSRHANEDGIGNAEDGTLAPHSDA